MSTATNASPPLLPNDQQQQQQQDRKRRRDHDRHNNIAIAINKCVASGQCVFDDAVSMIEYYELDTLAGMVPPVQGAAGVVQRMQRDRQREERRQRRAAAAARENGAAVEGSHINAGDDGEEDDGDDDDGTEWWQPFFAPHNLSRLNYTTTATPTSSTASSAHHGNNPSSFGAPPPAQFDLHALFSAARQRSSSSGRRHNDDAPRNNTINDTNNAASPHTAVSTTASSNTSSSFPLNGAAANALSFLATSPFAAAAFAKRMAVLPVAYAGAAVYVTASTLARAVHVAVSVPLHWTAEKSADLTSWVREGYLNASSSFGPHRRGTRRARKQRANRWSNFTTSIAPNDRNTDGGGGDDGFFSSSSSSDYGSNTNNKKRDAAPNPYYEAVRQRRRDEKAQRRRDRQEAKAAAARLRKSAGGEVGSSVVSATTAATTSGWSSALMKNHPSMSSHNALVSASDAAAAAGGGVSASTAGVGVDNASIYSVIGTASQVGGHHGSGDDDDASSSSHTTTSSSSSSFGSSSSTCGRREGGDRRRRHVSNASFASSIIKVANTIMDTVSPPSDPDDDDGDGDAHMNTASTGVNEGVANHTGGGKLKKKGAKKRRGGSREEEEERERRRQQRHQRRRDRRNQRDRVIFLPAMQQLTAKVLAHLSGEGQSFVDLMPIVPFSTPTAAAVAAPDTAAATTSPLSTGSHADDDNKEDEMPASQHGEASVSADVTVPSPSSTPLPCASGPAEPPQKGEEEGHSDLSQQQHTAPLPLPVSPVFLLSPYHRVFTCDEWIDFLLGIHVKCGEVITEHLVLTQHLVPLDIEMTVMGGMGDNDGGDKKGCGGAVGVEGATATADSNGGAVASASSAPPSARSVARQSPPPSAAAPPRPTVRRLKALYFPPPPTLLTPPTDAAAEAPNNASAGVAADAEESLEDAKALAAWKYLADGVIGSVAGWEDELQEAVAAIGGLAEEEGEARAQLHQAEEEEAAATRESTATPSNTRTMAKAGDASRHQRDVAAATAYHRHHVECLVERRRRIQEDIRLLTTRIERNKLVAIECDKLRRRLSSPPSAPLSLRQIVDRIELVMGNFGDGPWPQL